MFSCHSRVICQQSNKPITKDNLISSLKLGERERKTAEWYIKLIKQHGVDFLLTTSDEQRIREAGKYLGQKEVAELVAAVRSSYKVLILVAEFQSLDKKESPAVTEMIINQLRTASREYSDIKIRYLSEPITAQEGDDFARRKGKESGANFVIWGWYSRSQSNVYANVHFVFVKGLETWSLCTKSEEETFNSPLSESESYSLQTKIMEHMTYLTLFATGLARLEANDGNAAIEKFNQALKLPSAPEQIIDPAQIYHSRARAFLLTGDYNLAIADLDKVIVLKPIAQSYISRGLAYGNKGEYDLAIADFTQAIILDPKSTTAYYDRGVIYGNKGRYGLAIADYREVIALDPKYINAYFNRGMAYEHEGKLDLAITDYSKVITLNPDFVCAYVRRGSIYYKMDNQDLAITDYSYVITHHPDFTGTYAIYAVRGSLYEKKGRYDLAIADYSKLVTLDPKASAYIIRAGAYTVIGKYDLAIDDYSQAITLAPNDVVAHIYRGRLYQEKDKYDLAIADFSRAIILDPKHADAHFDRGLVYFIEGKFDLAVIDFTKTLTLDPEYTRAYLARGVVYAESGDTTHAVLDFNKVLQLSNDPELRRKAEQQLKQITIK